LPVYVAHTGTDEKVKFAVKRKAENTHEKKSPVKMKIGAAPSKGTPSGISIKVGQLVSFNCYSEITIFILYIQFNAGQVVTVILQL
jgi:hypothetical protein